MNHETRLTRRFGENEPEDAIETEYPTSDSQQFFAIQLGQLPGTDRTMLQNTQSLIRPGIPAATAN